MGHEAHLPGMLSTGQDKPRFCLRLGVRSRDPQRSHLSPLRRVTYVHDLHEVRIHPRHGAYELFDLVQGMVLRMERRVGEGRQIP